MLAIVAAVLLSWSSWAMVPDCKSTVACSVFTSSTSCFMAGSSCAWASSVSFVLLCWVELVVFGIWWVSCGVGIVGGCVGGICVGVFVGCAGICVGVFLGCAIAYGLRLWCRHVFSPLSNSHLLLTT